MLNIVRSASPQHILQKQLEASLVNDESVPCLPATLGSFEVQSPADPPPPPASGSLSSLKPAKLSQVMGASKGGMEKRGGAKFFNLRELSWF